MNSGKKHANKKSTTGQIRIIAGKHRGRKLPVLMADGLRPTTDRVKETVFNWLMPYIPQAQCLDCFAGSGGLGFEALSRGAKTVTLIELNKAAAKQLQANKALLSANEINVINNDALSFLQQTTDTFDVVFIDPPFRQNLVAQTAIALNAGKLTDNAMIYVEMEVESTQQLPSNWALLKEKTAGQVIYQLYQYQK
ncbi:16S rRNA (guanine(966)-N(2))-methyltransferase RsmD [Colwellia sp. D2M02]|uniref:16S rRNA (guanine(966)-N(2))-methyltransferase RsmD n=1 Tax=Colwellia sp. D2M02 TaxID=2841562 RepID=UPI001C08A292|nr:16S rRNA (guanine(966)-N(2))-methyltransferase RsmD [Colwellia sp. D2M02]MBU2891785.1 16S rRNA (guanine(966)-N(2))-methyltransferase RsmD [Colwellia sp. D2M02]